MANIRDSKRIAWNYLKGRFTVDVLASLPLEIVAKLFTSTTIDASTSNIFSMFKLTRLFRLGRMIHYFNLNPEFKFGMKMLEMFILIMVYINLITCIWMTIMLPSPEIDK